MSTGEWQVQLYLGRHDARVRWRLLSANNRDVGRSLRSYDTPGQARADIALLQSSCADLERRVRRIRPSEWSWEILSDGELVVSAGRPFGRLIRCEQALAQFCVRFGVARVNASVLDPGYRVGARPRRFDGDTVVAPKCPAS